MYDVQYFITAIDKYKVITQGEQNLDDVIETTPVLPQG